MSKKTFQLKILATDKLFYSGSCESLIVPSQDGKYGIKANHRNVVIAVVPGPLYYRLSEEKFTVVSVAHGLVKVEDNQVLVLVDSAERPEEINAKRAKQAATTAKEKLLQSKSKQEYYAAQARLARAMSRLQIRANYDFKKDQEKL